MHSPAALTDVELKQNFASMHQSNLHPISKNIKCGCIFYLEYHVVQAEITRINSLAKLRTAFRPHVWQKNTQAAAKIACSSVLLRLHLLYIAYVSLVELD